MLPYLLAALVCAGFLWLGYGLWQISAVSSGDPIPERPSTALLMIDLQTVFWDGGAYSDARKSAAQAAILREVDAAKSAGHPVIEIRQEWSQPAPRSVARLFMKGQALPGSEGTEFAAPFSGLADHALVKRVQDGFETGALDPLLAELDVGQLRIVGLDFNYCVLKTALAARARGFAVTVVADGTLAAGKTDKSKARLQAAGGGLA
ncbi:cysteine hydrolase family protein [Dinoroseobacter sp. S76]|uniref:cysteine hydrolase family protein n=1 Tax=Dinoroseobacter sp. S76 TaxID=3415124 RepID=UPI003C7BF776